jgi:hypothetical protein
MVLRHRDTSPRRYRIWGSIAPMELGTFFYFLKRKESKKICPYPISYRTFLQRLFASLFDFV